MEAGTGASFHFATLTPDLILDALASCGFYLESGLTPLGSYENRVYQFVAEDRQRYVVKFYRPQRWSAAQIQQEHQLALFLAEQEVSVAAPLVIAGRTLVNALLQYPMGKLADRYDKVHLLMWGCGAMSLAVWLIPSMHSFAAMVGIYLFLGLGEAVLWPVLGAFAVEEGRRFGHGTMMGVFNLAMSAGVFTGALVAGTGLDTLGMQAAFTLTGASIMVLCLVAAMLIRAGNRHDRSTKDESARETAH